MACYGLQNLDPNEESTKALVSALAKKVRSSDERLDGQAIGNACYGLQNLDPKAESTKTLVLALAKKISTISGDLNPQEIVQLVYAVKQLEEVPVFLNEIVTSLSRSGYFKRNEGENVNDTNSLILKLINSQRLQLLTPPSEKQLFYTSLFKVMLDVKIVGREQGLSVFEEFVENDYIELNKKGEEWDLHGHNEVTAEYATLSLLKKYIQVDSPKKLVLIHGRGNHSKFGNSIVKKAGQKVVRTFIARTSDVSVEYKEGHITLIKNRSVEDERGNPPKRRIVEGG